MRWNRKKAQGRAGKIAEALVKTELVILDELGYLPFSVLGRCAALPSSQQTLRAHQRHHHHQLELQRMGKRLRRWAVSQHMV